MSQTSQVPTAAARPCTIKHHFRMLKDPRRRHRRMHRLIDIVVIAISAVIAGAEDWHQVVTFARRRQDWLKQFLALPHGIPSHDTFERVFDRIDPKPFQACFQEWIAAVCDVLKIKQVAIDGKTLRHSGSKSLGPLHVVSAWATANHLILGQEVVSEKSNEITAIPRLLEMLDIEGALVTLDAMGCQKDIAQQIVDRGGDYVLTVKENQERLFDDIQQSFVEAFEREASPVDPAVFHTEERGHGRYEKRTYSVLYDLHGIRDRALWAQLTVIGMCYSERTVNGKTSEELRYFIGSRKASARIYGKALRNHWGIENGLHWHMDITFGEDASRIRKPRGAENFALLRRIALSLLKQHPEKLSVACKRFAAALDTDFLAEILCGTGNSEKP
jgi:predicted transposase YbfD/YdcC